MIQGYAFPPFRSNSHSYGQGNKGESFSCISNTTVVDTALVPRFVTQPSGGSHPLVIQNDLSPVALKVSGQASLVEESQLTMPVLSKNLEGKELGQIITRPGQSGLAGVINNKLIHLMQL